MASKKDNEEGKPLRSESVIEAYRRRLQVLRKAQEFARTEEIPKAVQQYNLYLNSLARYFDIKEEELSPKIFNVDQDITEMLLISQVYWDLAKAYDRSPKLQGEAMRCLNQFAKFTVGYKYQYVNAQMLKKYLRGRQAHNPKIFEAAYEKVRVEGKGCYVASCLYGPNHSKTQQLRLYREKVLMHFSAGLWFIDFYETHSPRLVNLYQTNPIARLLLNLSIKPLINLFVYLLGTSARFSHDRT